MNNRHRLLIPARLGMSAAVAAAVAAVTTGLHIDPFGEVVERYSTARKKPTPPTGAVDAVAYRQIYGEVQVSGLRVPVGPLRVGVTVADVSPITVILRDPMTDEQEARTFATWTEAQAWVDDRQARLLSGAIAWRNPRNPLPPEPDPTPEQWLRDYLPQPRHRVARKVMLPRGDEPHMVAAQAAALAVSPHETRAQRRERLRLHREPTLHCDTHVFGLLPEVE